MPKFKKGKYVKIVRCPVGSGCGCRYWGHAIYLAEYSHKYGGKHFVTLPLHPQHMQRVRLLRFRDPHVQSASTEEIVYMKLNNGAMNV